MVKSVDTRDLKSLGESCPGSSPGERTNYAGVPIYRHISGKFWFRLKDYLDCSVEQRNGTIKRTYEYDIVELE